MSRLTGAMGALPTIALSLAACRDVPTDAPAALALEVVQGAPSEAVPGFPVEDLLIVRVVDDRGRAVAGIPVSWGVEGGGSLVPGSPTSGDDGLSAARWTLGGRPGPNRATASVADQPAVAFVTEGAAFRVGLMDSDGGLGCGLREDGLWCWGRFPQFYGAAVAAAGGREPVLVDDTHAWTDLAVAAFSVCALDGAGTVHCIGESGYGTDVPAAPEDDFAPIAGLPPLSGIGTSQGWYCGLAAADSMPWCWNRELDGAEGIVVKSFPGGPPFVRLGVGGRTFGGYACGLAADSTAHCWGEGTQGQLGHGLFEDSAVPVPVSGGHRFIELAAGGYTACGRTAGGELWCWGDNESGQLGREGPGTAVPVAGPVHARRVVAGDDAFLAITEGGVIRWGFHSRLYRLEALDDLPVEAFAKGDYNCLLVSGGQVFCAEELWNVASSFVYDEYWGIWPR